MSTRDGGTQIVFLINDKRSAYLQMMRLLDSVFFSFHCSRFFPFCFVLFFGECMVFGCSSLFNYRWRILARNKIRGFRNAFFSAVFFSTINVVIKVVCARQKEQKFDFSTFFMFLTFIYARLHLNHLFYFMAITQSVFFSFWK